jgi:hypothetical protein
MDMTDPDPTIVPYLIDFADAAAVKECIDSNPGQWGFVYVGPHAHQPPTHPSTLTLPCTNCQRRRVWLSDIAEQTMTGRKWAYLLILCKRCGHHPPKWRQPRPPTVTTNEWRAMTYGASSNVLLHITSWGMARQAT